MDGLQSQCALTPLCTTLVVISVDEESMDEIYAFLAFPGELLYDQISTINFYITGKQQT